MELKERDCKHRTVQRYKQFLERINKEIGHLKLSNITSEYLNKFCLKPESPGANKKTGEPLSKITIRHHHRLIHMIFEQAIKENIIKFNVAKQSTPPKVDKKEADFFELDEILKIRDALTTQPIKWKTII